MPVLRRYCRVSKYTVLECRIYLDNPADLHSWLLSPRHNIIPRIFQSIKPLVLPKLTQERECGGKGKGKSKPVNDVVVEEDYSVSMFLTNSGTRHTLMTKRKVLQGGGPSKMTGNASPVRIVREEERDSDEGVISVDDIPEALVGVSGSLSTSTSVRTARIANKRKSPNPPSLGEEDEEEEEEEDPFEPLLKRPRGSALGASAKRAITIRDEDDDNDPNWCEGGVSESEDKKKLVLRTDFEGFSIYSRILCLVVKRRGALAGKGSAAAASSRQQTSSSHTRPENRIMEEWIAMSQAVKEGDEADE